MDHEMATDLDLDHHRTTADEFYAYDGDGIDKPPYWVARHRQIVTDQIIGREIRTVDCGSVPYARARFAGQTCDPHGPGAPQPGDVITIFWGDHEDEHLVVTAATRNTMTGDHDVHATQLGGANDGAPVILTLTGFQYEIILRRPSTT